VSTFIDSLLLSTKTYWQKSVDWNGRVCNLKEKKDPYLELPQKGTVQAEQASNFTEKKDFIYEWRNILFSLGLTARRVSFEGYT